MALPRRAEGQRGGRPHTGRTAQVWGRVSPQRRAEVDELADQYGIPLTQVIAYALDVAFEHDNELLTRLSQHNADQAELPLKAG